MKKCLILCLTLALLLSFAACKRDEVKPGTTVTTAATTTATAPESTNATTTETQPESTTSKADISFIFSGYWYKKEGNKVLALQFLEDGTVVVNTYRRNSIASADDTPDSVIYGSFTDNGDGSLYVRPDNEFPEEFYEYVADSSVKSLTCNNEDPQGPAQTALIYYSTLSKANAKIVLLGEN